MDPKKIAELTGFAENLKKKVGQATPHRWSKSGAIHQGSDSSIVSAGGQSIFDVLKTDPSHHAPANAEFAVYAHETADKFADGVLELVAEVQRLEKEVQALQFRVALQDAAGKGTTLGSR